MKTSIWFFFVFLLITKSLPAQTGENSDNPDKNFNTASPVDARSSLEKLHRMNNIDLDKLLKADYALRKNTAWNFKIGDKRNWWAADLEKNQYYQTSATCRGIGVNCYVFVEDSVWAGRVDQIAVNNIINAFDSSTPANQNKGIYQTNVETFGNPPDVDNDPRIIICILNIRDGYTTGGSYIAGYFDPLNELQASGSNRCEIYYLDCYPHNLYGPAGLRKAASTIAHEFQHMIMFNYHGMINSGQQETFFDEGSSLAAELVNGYPLYSQEYYNTSSNRPLLVWNPNNNLTDALNDYSRAARFFLYLKEQFGVSLFKAFNQSSSRGISALDGTALPSIGTSRRFSDIIADWWLANYINDKTVDAKWGYDQSENLSNVSSTRFHFSPNVNSQNGAVYKLAAEYITYASGENISINFSGIAGSSIKIKAIKIGPSGKQVVDVSPNTNFLVPDFGTVYNSVTFLICHINQNENGLGPFGYTYSSTGTLKPLGTFAAGGNLSFSRYQFNTVILNNWDVFIAGGYLMKGTSPNISYDLTWSSEVFKQDTEKFDLNLQNMIYPHQKVLMSKLFDGKVWIATSHIVLPEIEYYLPKEKSFQDIRISTTRIDPLGKKCVLLPNGEILILGSKSYWIPNGLMTDTVSYISNKLFTPSNNSFSSAGNYIKPRNTEDDIATALLPNGKILITGGRIDTMYFNGRYWTTANKVNWYSSAEIYNPDLKLFQPAGEMSSKRDAHSSTLLPNGKVLITGGYFGNNTPAFAELFDPETNTFTRIGNLNIPRFGHKAILLADGKVLVIGGDIGNGHAIATNEIFDPVTNTFKIASPLNTPRSNFKAELMGNGKVLIVGGYTDPTGVYVSTSEIYTPENYSISVPSSPVQYFPKDNEQNISASSLFSWHIVPGAIYYRLQISDKQDFSQVLIDTAEIPIIGIKINNILSDSKLFWRVSAINSSGESNWSSIRSFTTKAVPPDITILNYPQNNSTNVKNDSEINWLIKSNSSYHLQISKNITFNNIIIDDSTLAKSSYSLSRIEEGQIYYWRVRARNAAGTGPWSSIWVFTTEVNAPTNLSIQRSGLKELTLTWNDNSAGEEGYIVERKKIPEAGFYIIDTLIENSKKYIDQKIDQNITYSYRIKAFTKFTESDYSNESGILVVNVEREQLIPTEYSLEQNYPNPFNPGTMIKYGLPFESKVTVNIYNILGEQISSLVDGVQIAGYNYIIWNSTKYPSGIYFYRINARSTNGLKTFNQVKKMILMK